MKPLQSVLMSSNTVKSSYSWQPELYPLFLAEVNEACTKLTTFQKSKCQDISIYSFIHSCSLIINEQLA